MVVKILFIIVIACFGALAQAIPPYKMNTIGETKIRKNLDGKDIVILIQMKHLDSSSASYQANRLCSQKYECTGVWSILIVVDGVSIYTPTSVYCSMTNLKYADLSIVKKKMCLFVTGGDGGETYSKEIFFDKEHVKKVIAFSGMTKRDTSEITEFRYTTSMSE